MAGNNKFLTQLPINIYNLGSKAGSMLNFFRKELWERMNAPMGAKAVSIPVFLVNEAQMDTIYPPERRRALDPKKVRARLNEWREDERIKDEEKDKDLFKELEKTEEETWQHYKEVVAVGVYIKNFSHTYDVTNIIGLGKTEYRSDDAKSALQNLESPAIFLCPERIINWAWKENIPVELVLDKVYYHELGHAIMDSGITPYDKIWGRIIEESLANSIAYDRFESYEARLIQRLIKSQPAEYQGYAWLSEAFDRFPFPLHRFFLEELFYYDLKEFIYTLKKYIKLGLPFPLVSFPLEKSIVEFWVECKSLQVYQDKKMERMLKKFALNLLKRSL